MAQSLLSMLLLSTNTGNKTVETNRVERRWWMSQRKLHKKKSTKKEQMFQRGQTVIYQGEEARVLDVEPILTIITKNTNRLVCGDTLLNDLCLNSV
jgi:hypothetical protein